MIAINFTTARGRLKDFCDRVTDRGETVIVTRKAEKNVVIPLKMTTLSFCHAGGIMRIDWRENHVSKSDADRL